MTESELLCLMPTKLEVQTDEVFYRSLRNHWSMFGPEALVKKMEGKWWVDFQGHCFPCPFKTKKAAMEQADRWIEATQDK